MNYYIDKEIPTKFIVLDLRDRIIYLETPPNGDN